MLMCSWTPKVRRIRDFMAVIMGLRLLSYVARFWGLGTYLMRRVLDSWRLNASQC